VVIAYVGLTLRGPSKVARPAFDHAGAEEYFDIGCGAYGVDEVRRHALFERVASDNDGDVAGPLGEVERGLAAELPAPMT
jgi:hypothetical protein